MEQNTQETIIRNKFKNLCSVLDEQGRRLWAASEARALGRGGQSIVERATGITRKTISQGMKELQKGLNEKEDGGRRRIRTSGGGRKRLTALNPKLKSALEALVEPTTRGDPESHLRWTCKSTERLALELNRQGHEVSSRTVHRLLVELGYSLQANSKTKEGTSHVDRDAQFLYINEQVLEFQCCNQPVISVDTKKKELVGEYKNGGKEWRPTGKPRKVNTYDFPNKDLGKAIPYGVYDQTSDTGWVSVGVDHDTAEFALASIKRWWQHMGKRCYPKATELLITADGGGSNSSRSRLWKLALQEWADDISLCITVCHFPPGTSKWNKIEHRMFSHISMNWRGKPLTSHEVIVNLIANTTTKKGLKIQVQLDTNSYPKGRKVSDKEFKSLNLQAHNFCGNWNYSIKPRTPSRAG